MQKKQFGELHITVIYVHSRLRWHSYSKQLPYLAL